jgi:hypothetical protein
VLAPVAQLDMCLALLTVECAISQPAPKHELWQQKAKEILVQPNSEAAAGVKSSGPLHYTDQHGHSSQA